MYFLKLGLYSCFLEIEKEISCFFYERFPPEKSFFILYWNYILYIELKKMNTSIISYFVLRNTDLIVITLLIKIQFTSAGAKRNWP